MDSIFENLANQLEVTVDYLFEEFLIDEEINLTELFTTYAS
jgi:hypothetical protein